jgi:formylglycine-generating enzyme required for sulfatase activity
MTDMPDEIQRQIEQLEAMRATLGDFFVDEAIAKLRGQSPSPSGDTTDARQSQGFVDHPTESVEQTFGNASVQGSNFGQTIGVNLGTAIFGHPPDTRERDRVVRYLDKLACTLDQIPLRGLQQRTAQQQDDLSLPKVYTLLATTERIQVAQERPSAWTIYLDDDKLRKEYDPDHALPDQAILAVEREHITARGRQGDADDLPITLWRAQLAAEAVARYPRLVLLGDPGGGKSTFLRHLGWLSAQHTLERLSEDEQRLLPADLQTLLPLFVPLLHVARALAKPAEPDRSPAAVVTDTLMAVMRDGEAGDLSDHLGEVLHRGAALVLFDGLDEVPTEPHPGERANRSTTLRAVQEFARRNRQARIVITCRTRAFEPLNATLPNDWHTATLAPFTLGQMRYFVDVWYDELATHTQIAADQVAELKRMLIADIQRRERLRDMAETPLLLTMMALVLYNKGELPRDRPKLYDAILELLLGQWDRVRDGQTLTDVVDWRDWTSERIRPVLDRLSYEAHRDATSADGRGRLSKMAVEWALRQHLAQAGMPEDEAAKAATRVARYMEQRSGLLQPAADDYEFAHLTLQEHCAGRHLVRQSKAMPLILEHRTDDRWREPIFLGLGTIQEGNPWLIESVLRRLIQRDEQDDPAHWYRDLILAAEIGEDRDWAYLAEQGLDVTTIQHDLRNGLVTLLNDAAQPLPVAERVWAGFLLGDLGDPRFPVTVAQWRAEAEKALNGNPGGYFCKVEAGTYLIGSSDDDPYAEDDEKPQHTVTFEHPFWIGRYPITKTQWQEWVARGGEQAHPLNTFSASNQPVSVKWQMAVNFCTWLSQETKYVIRLPSEYEWEAGARGGDARVYPWGHKWHVDYAATEEDKDKRRTSWSVPVGCYPAGATPCGAFDMIGNMWEWTNSQSISYGWQDTQRRHDQGLMSMPKTASLYGWMVVRGGGHNWNKVYARCAARPSYNPQQWHGDDGFRLVLAPYSPTANDATGQ